MMDTSEIVAISFDLDGTLLDLQGGIVRGLEAVIALLEQHRAHIATLMNVDSLTQLRNDVGDEMGWAGSWESIREVALRRAVSDIANIDDTSVADEVVQVFFDHRFGNVFPFPDAEPAINALQERFKLGYATNGNTDPLRCGIPDCFGFQVTASQEAMYKPDPSFFSLLCVRAELQPNQILHIGDSLIDDVSGARSVGMPVVWLNREGLELTGEAAPDATVPALAEFVELLNP